jgi:hypothetical protein
MSEGNIDSRIRKGGLIRGLFLGFIVLALSLISFYFITSASTTPVMALVTLYGFSTIIPLAAAIFLAFNLRGKLGGYWTFKQAVTGTFIMVFSCYILLLIGRDLLFVKFVEPDMSQKTEAAMLKNSASMYKQQGVQQAQIDAKIADMKKQFGEGQGASIGGLVSAFFETTILLFVLSVLIAAVSKKESPAYLEA